MDQAAKERLNRLHQIAMLNKILYIKDGTMGNSASTRTSFSGSTKLPYSFRGVSAIRNTVTIPSMRPSPYPIDTSSRRKWRLSNEAEPAFRAYRSGQIDRERDRSRSPHKCQPANLAELLGTEKYTSYAKAHTSSAKYPHPVTCSRLQIGNFRREARAYGPIRRSQWNTKHRYPSSRLDLQGDTSEVCHY